MQDGQVGDLAAAHAVADADDGAWHLLAEDVDHVQEVAAVVQPCRYKIVSADSGQRSAKGSLRSLPSLFSFRTLLWP